MSALTDILRERASRRGRTARVDCGALGGVTVEALPLAECTALARQGARAVLYAACRELQESGEELRREGGLYKPDEIMQYVTEEEAAEAARTVMYLSGLVLEEPETPEEPEAPEESEELERLVESAEPESGEMETPPEPSASGSSGERRKEWSGTDARRIAGRSGVEFSTPAPPVSLQGPPQNPQILWEEEEGMERAESSP